MNRRVLALSFVLLLWRSSTASVAEEVVFAVLSTTQVTHLERLCSRESPGRISSGWDPAFGQIALAEGRLHRFVTANRRPSRPLGEYYRQYLGVVIDGRKLIYVNLFPRSLVERRELGGVLRDHWWTDFVDVCDGGDAFWGVLFDPAALRFFSPRFNGVA